MMRTNKLFAVIMMILMICGATLAQTPTKRSNSQVQPNAPSAPVTGGGTQGQITKWTSFSTISDSVITEDKNGNIGIGTPLPTSKLTVQGMIETTLGGIKFPDGTVQTTGGIASAVHDDTLQGNGTSASPLGIHLPLLLRADLASNAIIYADNINSLSGIGIVGLGRVYGIQGGSNLGDGVHGESNTGKGVFGRANFKEGFGGFFEGFVKITSNGQSDPNLLSPGNLVVTGTISKGGGSFKIDHPLDPENKYLYHSFVESPDMKNIYDGVVKLDANGEAMIELPEWFEALNRDYRYLLTAIGAPAPSLYVAEKVNNNRFKVAGGVAGLEVSWQVTGIRQDAFANAHRIKVEEDKSKEERGYYLHPTEHGQPAEKSVDRAPDSEMMRRMKEAREEAMRLRVQPN
jgi:hypothetical protein